MIKDMILPEFNKTFPKNHKVVISGILKYLDKYNHILSDIKYHKRPYFVADDENLIFKASGFTPNEIKGFMKNSPTYEHERMTAGNPFYVICLFAVSWFLNNKKEKEARLLLYYMCIRIYVSKYSNYLQFGGSEEVMEYIVNNKISGTKLAEERSIGGMIKGQTDLYIDGFSDKIKNPTDENIMAAISDLVSRINGRLKTLVNIYRKTKDSGDYILFKESDDLSEESYHVRDSDLFKIESITRGLYNDILNGKINPIVYDYASSPAAVSKQKFSLLLKDIIDDVPGEDIRRFISAIIEYYYYYDKNSLTQIQTNTFSRKMMSAYTSSTISKQMDVIKKYLDDWLEEYSSSMGSTRYGSTAKANYKKALYVFFVYSIQKYDIN